MPVIPTPIPAEIKELGKRVQSCETPDALNAMKLEIIKATAENTETFSYIQKLFVRQKRKLGMKCNAPKMIS